MDKMAKVFLLTGYSGAGKTTLATKICQRLDKRLKCVVLDGDEMRKGLSRDLGFSHADREENIRRCGELAKLLARQNTVVFLAVIAPYEHLREMLKTAIGPDNFRIVHVACPLEVCMRRDPKDNYKKAVSGELKSYTGIGDSYELPKNADLVLHTDTMSEEEALQHLESYVLGEVGKSQS